MTFRVMADTEIETPAGLIELRQGQVIRLAESEAMPLIEAGIITPEGRVAYKVYSNILQSFLWVVQDDAGAEELRAEGITGAVYTGHEIAELRGLDREGLKAVHNVKTVFEKSEIKSVRLTKINHMER